MSNKEWQEWAYVRAENGEAAQAPGKRVVSQSYSPRRAGFEEPVLWKPG